MDGDLKPARGVRGDRWASPSGGQRPTPGLLRLPAGTFLGPTLLSAVLTLTGAIDGVAVPPLLREAAFAAIGLYIGLRFERETLRQIGQLLVSVLVSIVALIAGCFLLAWVLKVTANVWSMS